MTIQKARLLLGEEAETLSDVQIEKLIKDVSSMCEVFLDLTLTESGSNLISKSNLSKKTAIT